MKNKLILIAAFFSLWSCKNTETKVTTDTTIETIDSVATNEASPTVETFGKAPDFSLKEINGKQYTLADLKGKYVYMDIWATWCGPCRVQIPFMKQLEENFKDAPIHFVSVSVDSESDKPEWERMVKENQMSGIQLFAGRENKFGYDYQIQVVPTFIILDKEGNIITPNAPAPMDYATGTLNQDLVDILKSLP